MGPSSDMMAIQRFHTMVELDSRVGDGIHVRLLWSGDDGRAIVAVADSKTGAGFVLDIGAGDSPLDVFHHPYAYAAWRGVETHAGRAGAELVGLLAA